MSENRPAAPTAVEADPVMETRVAEQHNEPADEVKEEAAEVVKALAPLDSTPEQLAAVTDKMIDEKAKLDDFYRFGFYTLIVCLLAELMILSQVGNMLYMTFAGAAPTLVSCGRHTFGESEKANARCGFLSEVLGSREKSRQLNCSHENIVLNSQFHSVNVEFGHHCHTQQVKSTITYQMIGVIFGSILFGWLSDSYGRRKIMLFALICCILSMVATTFTQNLWSFTAARFMVNFFNAGTMVTLVVFTSEHYPKDYRFALTNVITWSPNFVIFAIMAWISGDWRILHRVSAACAAPCILILLYLSESPRFLIQSRRIAEAKEAILRMHRIDGRPCPESALDSVLEREQRQFLEASKKQKKYNYVRD